MEKEKDKKDMGELCSINICCAENGYKISCCYQSKDSLSARAGWVPTSCCAKDYVAKTKASAVEIVKKVLAGDCPMS
jgi:hypothetical protein